VVPAAAVGTLVTDESAPADELDALRGHGVTVVCARAPVHAADTPLDAQGGS
jgi:hypothetical protein